ncbi:hypothetical protein JTB14_035129 [Gonioctena quinquepunctata]|nr:hypothetical protein JTB14_035129 [Gonioctena quinquepunctata]
MFKLETRSMLMRTYPNVKKYSGSYKFDCNSRHIKPRKNSGKTEIVRTTYPSYYTKGASCADIAIPSEDVRKENDISAYGNISECEENIPGATVRLQLSNREILVDRLK